MTLTANLVATIIGILISVGLEIVPGVKKKWTEWRFKPLVLFLGFTLVPVILWLLICLAGLDLKLTMDCSIEELIFAIVLGVTAFGGSQVAYKVGGVERLPNARARNGS